MIEIKLKKCAACTGEFKPFKTTDKACSPECAMALMGVKYRKKQANKERKEFILRKKVFHASDIKLRKKTAQTAFNAFIRARDSEQPCISCLKFHKGQYHAGHYKTVGAHPELRFNEDNCHKQCSVCNNHLSGNIGLYTQNLINKIGQKRYSALISKQESKKLTCEDYKLIEQKYKKKLKELN